MLASAPVLGGPASPSARAEAKAEFSTGQKAFAKRDYAEALSHFKKAFGHHPHDAVRFNIAVCLEKLGRFREAMLEYEAAAKSDQLDEGARKDAEAKAAAARAELGTLEVQGSPEGAEVLVAGEQVCNLPCTVELDARKHEIVVRSGEMRERREVVVRRQAKSLVHIELVVEGGAPPSESEPTAPTSSPALSVALEPDAAPTETRGPGWLTWTGAGLVVLGGVGIGVFGTQATSKHDEFVDTGSEEARDDGVRARNLTNVSIGVAALGVIAIGVDLLIFANQPEPRSARAPHSLELRF
jgi:hypothetical protein